MMLSKWKTQKILGLVGVILISMVISILIFWASPVSEKTTQKTPLTINGVTYKVSKALTHTERQKGLMFIETLPKKEGMLFIFDTEDYHTFWMKNTYIPLDIIWINQAKKIVHLHPSATPHSLTPMVPLEKATHVLEINADEILKHGFKKGMSVQFN
jgi:uncharacterized membrane protein (UPF0127 family)